jgi:hypothetical protein
LGEAEPARPRGIESEPDVGRGRPAQSSGRVSPFGEWNSFWRPA